MKVGAPSGLMVDDAANRIFGLDASMEYSTDGGVTYTPYVPGEEPLFEGDLTVLVRYKEDYSAGYEVGETEEFTFTVNLPEPVESVSGLANIPVANGTELGSVGLPTEVEVTLSNGDTANAGVTWDGGSPAYNGNVAGTYVFTGTLTLPEGVSNPNGLTAKVNVIVGAAPVESVSGLANIPVANGTELSSVGLPTEVEVTLSNGDTANADVTWDGGSPAYNGNVAGTYAFTGTLTLPEGVSNPDGLTAKVNVVVGAAPVESVSGLANIPVANGTELGSVGLPTEVEVTLSNGDTANADVTWDGGSPAYNGNVAGTYAFTGTLTLPEGVSNPNGLKAKVNVIVDAAPMESVEGLADIPVANGTELGSVGLPTEVEVTLSNGDTANADVTWDGGSPAYNGNVAGTYAFTGTLTLPEGVSNPNGLTAKVNVIVDAAPVVPITVAGVMQPSVITVVYGTSLAEVDLPAQVEVALSNDTVAMADVAWDTGNPSYDGNTPGTYTFTGTLTLPEGVTNPDDFKASVEVVVADPANPEPPNEVVVVCETSGCTASFGEELSIEIPGNVYDGPFTLTMRKVEHAEDLVPAGFRLLSPVFELLKSFAGNFKTPITIHFAFDFDGIGDGRRAALFYYNEETALWVEVAGTVASSTFVAKVDHFTKFAVFSVEEETEPEPLTIAGISDLEDIEVANGTVLDAVALPAQAEVTLNDGARINVNVMWDGGTPAYDGNVAGTYAFEGSLALPEGITNPQGITAKVRVIVADPIASPQTPVPIPANPNERYIVCGASGCTAGFGDELELIIPGNAYDGAFTLTIKKSEVDSERIPADYRPLSPVFDLLNSFGGALKEPVAIRMKFAADSVGEERRAALFFYDESLERWVEIEGRTEGDVFAAQIARFSKVAVFSVPDDEAEEEPSVPPAADFSDIGGHWAQTAILEAAAKGIVTGYADGSFLPDQAISRVEFVAMLVRALGLSLNGGAPNFADSEAIYGWARPLAAAAVDSGLVSGYADQTFRPAAPISRAEMTTMIARALQLPPDEEASAESFSDSADIPAWAKAAAAAAGRAGLVAGKSGGRFAPFDQATRAEAAVIILRLLEVAGQAE
ncbi:Ig-like domain-containing protein [Cohnella algarum]|uniref:Ig-like domain-containing protein n=1 Tax=Cohnella algarum TaxID=2044859 RepID=UPI001967B6FF|nr:Ig-like domain-containing protein [Cohnella algarum]MBN2980357.1 Ig-like domain-containing protein [Cohnella algarum]